MKKKAIQILEKVSLILGYIIIVKKIIDFAITATKVFNETESAPIEINNDANGN